MTSPRKAPPFDAVILDLLASVPKPDHTTVTAWMRRFPEHAEAIAEFSAAWVLSESLPPTRAPKRVDAEARLKSGMAILEKALYQDPPEGLGDAEPIKDLLEEGKRRGLPAQKLASVVGLSAALLAKLSRRLFRFESIPRLAVNRIAEALGLAAQSIERYLQEAPMLAPGASHRSEKPPAVAEPEDFGRAVQADRSLTEAQRAYWLAQVRQASRGTP